MLIDKSHDEGPSPIGAMPLASTPLVELVNHAAEGAFSSALNISGWRR